MKYIVCPDCKKKSPFQEKYAGRKIKCSCGNSFRCLIDLEEKIDQSISNCLNCNEELKTNWKSCPACGKDSHVISIKNKNSNPEISPPTKNPISPKNTSLNPIMNIGSDNVIKAEINASTNITNDNSVRVKGKYIENQSVNVDGDIVDKKEVINNFNETHIHERESAWVKIFSDNTSNNRADDEKEKRNKLEKEFENLKKSDDDLFAFSLKLLAALESTSYADAVFNSSTFQLRSSLCAQSLALIECQNTNNLDVTDKVEKLKIKLDKLVKDIPSPWNHIKPLILIFTIIIILCAIVIIIAERYDNLQEKEIFQLIAEGKYGEARVRAASLRHRAGEKEDFNSKIIQAINTAEQNEKDKLKKK